MCWFVPGDKPVTDSPPPGSPACRTQKGYAWQGLTRRFPHVEREDYSKP